MPAYEPPTPFARWLWEKIDDTPLNEVERRSRKAGVPIAASSLSTYIHGLTEPGAKTIERLARFFGTPEADIWTLVHRQRIGGRASSSPNDAGHTRVSEPRPFITDE